MCGRCGIERPAGALLGGWGQDDRAEIPDRGNHGDNGVGHDGSRRCGRAGERLD